MVITRTLQNTIDFARTFNQLLPIVGVGGFTNEPGLTIANRVIQTMISRPWAWKFNRKELATFLTVDKTQDYTSSSVSDVAWVESCELEDNASTSTPKPIHEIEVVQDLPREYVQDNPSKVCKLSETAGATPTTVFRFWKVPSTTIWRVYITYQQRAVIKSSLTDTWTPFPDDLAWVYEQGFLAWAKRYAGASDWRQDMDLFHAYIERAVRDADVEQQHEGIVPAAPLMRG